MLAANRNESLSKSYTRSADRSAPRDRAHVKVEEHCVGNFDPSVWVTAVDVGTGNGALQTWPARFGDDPTQPLLAKRPDFGAQLWSQGGPAVVYDNVGEAHQLSTLDLSTVDSATIGVNYQVSATGATRILFLYGGTLTWNGKTLHYGVGNGDVGYSVAGDGAGNPDHIEITNDALASQPRSTVIVVDRSLNGSDQIKFYDAAGAMAKSTAVNANVTGNFGPPGTCYIGAENDGASGASDAVIRDVVVWPIALGQQEATAAARALSKLARLS